MKETIFGWLFKYISGLPFYESIANLLSQFFPWMAHLDEMFDDLPNQQMLANFSGVLLAAFLMMLVRLIFNIIGSNWLTKHASKFIELYSNDLGKSLNAPIFSSKFLNMIFGLEDSVLGKAIRAIIDVILLFLINLIVDPFVTAISDFLSGRISGLSGEWIELITLLIVIIVVSLLYNLVYFIGNKVASLTGGRQIFTTVLTGQPILRSLVVCIIPEVFSVLFKDAAIIALFMVIISDASLDKIIIGILLVICAIVLSNYLGDVLRFGVVKYFNRTPSLQAVADIFAFLEEMTIVIFMLSIALANISNYSNAAAVWMKQIPFLYYLGSSESISSMLGDPSALAVEIAHCMIFLFVLIGLNRLYYALPFNKIKAGIVVTAAGWWFKVSFLVVVSAASYTGILWLIGRASTTVIFIVTLIIIFLLLYFYPPMFQIEIAGTAVVMLVVYISTKVNIFWWAVGEVEDVIQFMVLILIFILVGFIFALIHSFIAVSAQTQKLASAATKILPK